MTSPWPSSGAAERDRASWQGTGGPEAVGHQVDLAVGQATPVGGTGQWSGEKRRGHDQVLGIQVGSQFAGGLSAHDQAA